MPDRLQQRLGVWRSLVIYYGNPLRQRRMTQFYSAFVSPGSLCFDIGAHVGNRIRPWLRLGARVVALEPQPQLMPVLQRLYGRCSSVVLLSQAVGAEPGTATLLASPTNPTVATLSADWVAELSRDAGFAGITWQPAATVTVTTLDHLIDQYGWPDYCKIDVEGYELDVLMGLSQALPMVSFEYIPSTIDRAMACVERLQGIG